MEAAALARCLTNVSCFISQSTSGLVIGMLTFLVASGLTLIFGVLKVVNFAHGAFYMLGAYIAYSVYMVTGSFLAAVVAAALLVGLFAALIERTIVRRIYGADVLMQLLIFYALALILDDVVGLIWGVEFLSMGMPSAFRMPPFRFAGSAIPPYYLVAISTSVVIAVALYVIITYTKFGKIVQAAALNSPMVSALGVNTKLIFLLVFGLGGALAGLAGALAAPMRSLTPGLGLSILLESFVVTVIGGMGSIGGALVASILVGLFRAWGSIGFPQFTNGFIFVLMLLVLIARPGGLSQKG
jgi:branched-chain amino acid transport system permease protein